MRDFYPQRHFIKVTLCLIIFVGNVISHPQCTRDLQPGRLYSVADAEYDVCTKYPEDIKARAFSIQGISEKLVIDENEDKKFLLSPNGQTGAMELIVREYASRILISLLRY